MTCKRSRGGRGEWKELTISSIFFIHSFWLRKHTSVLPMQNIKLKEKGSGKGAKTGYNLSK